ncbi:MAG TPA: LysM peptidoglycan-binding domain-containing protein [Anaerolineales bacterium]|nr:LysM peptidoglycan-binding domain-containing protein [Anaerolineales bacterium]
MENRGSTGEVIASYRRRRQQGNVVFIYGTAGLLIVAGIGLLVLWLTGPSRPLGSLFATDTPTPTQTYTPTVTSTPTETPTITATATLTATATPSAPFVYTVQEGDSLAAVVEKFALGDDGIPLILMLNPFSEDTGTGIDPATQIVYPGQQIFVPNPDLELPTSTPIPANISRGTVLSYVVRSGDSLAGIAGLFNSTVEDIVETNDLADANAIFVGQSLNVRVNLVTPTATRPPTSTPRTPLPPSTPTAG